MKCLFPLFLVFLCINVYAGNSDSTSSNITFSNHVFLSSPIQPYGVNSSIKYRSNAGAGIAKVASYTLGFAGGFLIGYGGTGLLLSGNEPILGFNNSVVPTLIGVGLIGLAIPLEIIGNNSKSSYNRGMRTSYKKHTRTKQLYIASVGNTLGFQLSF